MAGQPVADFKKIATKSGTDTELSQQSSTNRSIESCVARQPLAKYSF
jgi:hypothetical protein